MLEASKQAEDFPGQMSRKDSGDALAQYYHNGDRLHQINSTPLVTRSRDEDGDGWDTYVEYPQTHYPRQPYAGEQVEGVGRDARRKPGGGQWTGE